MNAWWKSEIPVPENAKPTDRVWVVDELHNRVTNRKIGKDTMKHGAFPSCTVYVGCSKDDAYRALLEHRKQVLDAAKLALERAERSMNSALSLASREGVSP
jgi:hypothetical protein